MQEVVVAAEESEDSAHSMAYKKNPDKTFMLDKFSYSVRLNIDDKK